MIPQAQGLLDQAAAILKPHRPGQATPVSSRPAANFMPQVGVDLGTANVVLLVLDPDGRPLAGRYHPAQVVRDGVVVDFIGAVDLLRAMKAEVEAGLGFELESAASGFPPGVPEPEVQAVRHVLQSAGLDCPTLIDEPSAANRVLGLQHAAIVDVGGGTTGVAIIEDGEVIHSADEATGGTHFSLVIAGALNITLEQAERLKLDPDQQTRLLALVRPVMQKVATIVARQLERYPVPEVVLVGGSCAFQGMDRVVAETLQMPVRVAPHPLWVTPLGIAATAGNGFELSKFEMERSHA